MNTAPVVDHFGLGEQLAFIDCLIDLFRQKIGKGTLDEEAAWFSTIAKFERIKSSLLTLKHIENNYSQEILPTVKSIPSKNRPQGIQQWGETFESLAQEEINLNTEPSED